MKNNPPTKSAVIRIYMNFGGDFLTTFIFFPLKKLYKETQANAARQTINTFIISYPPQPLKHCL